MNGGKWFKVNRSNPCPSCGKHDWCEVSPDGRRRKCRRKAPEGVPFQECNPSGKGRFYLFDAGAFGSVNAPEPELGTSVTPADAATRHRVYTAIVDALGAERLSPEHTEQLHRRGFAPAEVQRNGYFTYPDTEAKPRCLGAAQGALAGIPPEGVPGLYREGDDPTARMVDRQGLAIPVRDVEGRIVALRIRVERDGEKQYLWLTGPKAENSIGSSPGAICHVPLHDASQRSGEVRVTEGEFKADLATARTNVLTISIPGVGQWNTAISVLRELGARRVRLALDGDARTKPQVALALQDLAAACAVEGWEVAVETWPTAWKGIDDALVASDGGRDVVAVHAGADAWEILAEIVTAAGEVPAEGVGARTRIAKLRPRIEADPGVAMSAEAVEAAAALCEHASSIEFKRFANDMKKLKVPHGAWNAAVKDARRKLAAARETEPPPNPEGLPAVVVTTEEGEVADAVIEALASHATAIYQRDGKLVRVVSNPLGPAIQQFPKGALRELISRCAMLLTEVPAGDGGTRLVRVHVPPWLVDGIHERGIWPKIPVLRGVVETAVLRPDGTVLDTPGYDAASGLLLVPNGDVPRVPERPIEAEVKLAVALLDDLVCDFPFETPAHCAVWMAALLTPFARYAFEGPVPLYAFDGNLRGVGKSKLTDIIAILFTGRAMPRHPYTPNEEEMKKTVTSVASMGSPFVLLDNVAGVLGGAALDMVLTGEIVQDRRFGRNDEVMRFQAKTIWLASGNNLVFGGDLVRRVAFCRLQSPEERPEARKKFKYPDLLAHVRRDRTRYVAAALTVLRAYFAAGRPRQDIPAWGSFEAYSEVVRQALVFAGQPDPAETREELPDGARDLLEQLIEGWIELYPDGREVTVAEVLDALAGPEGERATSLRVALEEISGGQLFRMESGVFTVRVSAGKIAKRLDAHRDRSVNGYCLQKRSRNERGVLWRVVPSASARGGGDVGAVDAVGGQVPAPRAHSNSAAIGNSTTQTKSPENTNSINSTNSRNDVEFRP